MISTRLPACANDTARLDEMKDLPSLANELVMRMVLISLSTLANCKLVRRALMLSLTISMVAGKRFITYMKRKRHFESARDAEIDPYGVQKNGTPSMGGVIIVGAVVIPALLLGRLDNVYINLLIVTILWFGLLGFIDDYIKLKGNKDGMKPRYKLLGQLALGCVVGIVLWLSPDAVVRENVTAESNGQSAVVYHKSEARKSTVTTVPFLKNNNLDYYEVFNWIKDGKVNRGNRP